MEDMGQGLKETFSAITWEALVEASLVVAAAALLIFLIQKLVPRVAGKLGGKSRLYLLASVPLARLLIIIITVIVVVPILVEPSFENMIAIFGALGLALGFAFKDYANSLIAGIVTLYEMPYRPGDWIEVATCVGAKSAMTPKPGITSKLAAMVRYCGLYASLSWPGWPGSLPTSRYMLANMPEGDGAFIVMVEGISPVNMPFGSDSSTVTSRSAKSSGLMAISLMKRC